MKRVVLVGHGYFGSLYRERIQQSSIMELAAIVEPDYGKTRNLEGVTICDSYQHAVDNIDHDGVIICTPPQHHCELSILAMTSGKHVLCMKPGAMSMTEASLIGETADKTNRLFEVDYTLLNAPEYAFVYDQTIHRQLAKSMGFYRNLSSAPKSEGAILDLFSHDAALLYSLRPFIRLDDLRVKCVSDAVSASATLMLGDEQVAFFSGGYNAPFPIKKASVWIKPDEDMTNPRLEYAWDQNARSVTLHTQGDSVRFQFKHDPDPITISIDRFAWAMKYEVGSSFLFLGVMRLLHAMMHSASTNGSLVKVNA